MMAMLLVFTTIVLLINQLHFIQSSELIASNHSNLDAIIDQLMLSDNVEIYDGIKFIRDKSKQEAITYRSYNNPIGKILNVLQTHLIEIRLNQLFFEQYAIEQGRRRRNQMMPLFIFGIILMGMVLIPMGFKFLAVLGGKALLLAKMALLLSSIQGLKRVATSNLNYGLYQAPPVNPWHYDRQWYAGNQVENPNFGILPSSYNDIEEPNDLLHNAPNGPFNF